MKLLTNFTKRNQAMNDHKRNQEALAEAKRQFLQAVASGQLRVLDRFGNPIEQGDHVFYAPASDLSIAYRVVAIGPNMDPRAPVGSMIVQLTCELPVGVPAGVPNINLAVVARAEPVQPSAANPSGNGASIRELPEDPKDLEPVV
jgi:hypothetical protein